MEPRSRNLSQKFLYGYGTRATRIGDVACLYRVTRFDTGERLESICKIPRVTVRKVSERGNGVQSTRENEVFNDILKTLYNRDYRH